MFVGYLNYQDQTNSENRPSLDSPGDKIDDPDGITFDRDLLRYLNIIQATSDQYRVSNKGANSHLMIIDEGLNPLTWNELITHWQQNYGVTPQITYIRVAISDWQSEDPDVTYQKTTNPNNPIVQERDETNSEGIHGSMMVSCALQVMPKGHIYIVDMFSDNWQYINSGNFQENSNYATTLRLSLDAINYYNLPVDTVSISQSLKYHPTATGSFNTGAYNHFRQRIQYYRNTKKIQFFVSSSNEDYWNQESDLYISDWWKMNFPACYPEVVAVGALYDDKDGYFTAGSASSSGYTGWRVDYDHFPTATGYVKWGSVFQASPTRHFPGFVAPGFDVDVLFSWGYPLQAKHMITDGGTSESTVILASIASQVYHNFYWVPASPWAVYDVLRRTAESPLSYYPYDGQKVNNPVAGSYNEYTYSWSYHMGYGCSDFIDAYNYATEYS